MTDKHLSDDANDIAYPDRGSDSIENLTHADEAEMDRAAQAGVAGAFGAVEDDQARKEMRGDAEEAFGSAES